MDEQPQSQPQQQPQSNGYGKRPLWQWIVLYAVIAVVVYGLVYYFVFAKKGGYNSNSSNSNKQQYSQSQSTNSTTGSASPQAMVGNSIAMTKIDPAKGSYLTDTKGMTLYVFDKDQPQKSNCSGTCLANWPIFAAPSAASTNPVNDFGVIQSTDGKYMYTYKNMPLYYYIKDKQPGDTTGDGVGGVWHLVKP